MNAPVALLLLSAISGTAIAQDVQFDLIPGMYPLDMSADGSVIVGNDANFETVRWTESTGVVNLGRGTFAPLGIGGGTPDISDDGTRISATITTDNGMFATQGLWSEEGGWQDLLSPLPSDGGLIDNSYGSAWGLSGNGEHVVGFYWRPGNGGPGGDGLAHASFSTPTGVIDLGSTMRDSRGNHANFDGSVVVGWDTSNAFGYWSPTVWDNGVLTHLNTNLGWAMANFVTPDGNIIGGYTFNEIFKRGEATVWHRTESGWDQTILGVLPGTINTALVRAMTPDGSIMVGYNEYNNLNVSGFIWTAETGMEEIEDWLTDRGIVIPSDLNILDVTSISHDGTIIAGIGASNINGLPIGFVINTAGTPCSADLDANGVLDFFDISNFLSNTIDFNGDTIFDFFDVSSFLQAFSAGCS